MPGGLADDPDEAPRPRPAAGRVAVPSAALAFWAGCSPNPCFPGTLAAFLLPRPARVRLGPVGLPDQPCADAWLAVSPSGAVTWGFEGTEGTLRGSCQVQGHIPDREGMLGCAAHVWREEGSWGTQGQVRHRTAAHCATRRDRQHLLRRQLQGLDPHGRNGKAGPYPKPFPSLRYLAAGGPCHTSPGAWQQMLRGRQGPGGCGGGNSRAWKPRGAQGLGQGPRCHLLVPPRGRGDRSGRVQRRHPGLVVLMLCSRVAWHRGRRGPGHPARVLRGLPG